LYTVKLNLLPTNISKGLKRYRQTVHKGNKGTGPNPTTQQKEQIRQQINQDKQQFEEQQKQARQQFWQNEKQKIQQMKSTQSPQ